jgi:uncharacterized protein (TIGR03083 family)
MSLKQLSLRAVREDAAALAAAGRVDPAARVPSCPEWSLRELVDHTGRVHHWCAGIVASRSQDRVRFADQPGGPGDAEAGLAWFEAGTAALLAALDGVDEETPVWNWFRGVAPARFWMRRMALETAMHRWDGQAALMQPAPVDAAVALLGVDEMLEDLLPLLPSQCVAVSSDATLHLHCTDAGGEWLVRFTPDGAVVSREHAKGDVAVRATASDLYLLLWNRIGPEHLEVFGDEGILRGWAEHIRI